METDPKNTDVITESADHDDSAIHETSVQDAAGQEALPQELPKVRRGVGYGALIFMSLLAAIAGVIGGGLISPVINKHLTLVERPSAQAGPAATDAAVKALQTQMINLEAASESSVTVEDMQGLEARLNNLESQIRVAADGTVLDPQIMQRLETLEMAEKAAPTDLTGVTSRLDALEAQSRREPADPSGVIYTSDLKARLAALEALPLLQEGAQMGIQTDPSVLERLAAVESIEIPAMPEPVDLSPIVSRISQLESQFEQMTVDMEKAAALRAAIPLPPFPRSDIVAAMSGAVESDQGWMSRTLNKHVKVRDTSLILIVDDIEALLLQGEVDAALARVQDLPQEGRTAAQSWVEAVKAQRTSL